MHESVIYTSLYTIPFCGQHRRVEEHFDKINKMMKLDEAIEAHQIVIGNLLPYMDNY